MRIKLSFILLVLIFFVVLISFLMLDGLTSVKAGLKETDVVDLHCQGEVEYRLRDKTRVDCLTRTHAFEYDWGKKWAEAVGQSLHYASMTNRQPGIVLILRDDGDLRYLKRLENVVNYFDLPIKVVALSLSDVR